MEITRCTYRTGRWPASIPTKNRRIWCSLKESSVMAFTHHDEGDSGAHSFLVILAVHTSASVSQSWHLFLEDYFVLTLPNPVTVDENICGQFSVTFSEENQTSRKHFPKHHDYLLAALIDAKVCWPLRKIHVDACHHGSYAWCAFFTRRGMSHVDSHHHGWNFENRAECALFEYVVGSAELEIDFLEQREISNPQFERPGFPNQSEGTQFDQEPQTPTTLPRFKTTH